MIWPYLRGAQVLDFRPPHLTFVGEIAVKNFPTELLLGEVTLENEVAFKF